MSRLSQTLLCGLMLAATAAAGATDFGGLTIGGDTTVTTPREGNLVIMGGHIEVLARIGGNLVATGGDVDIRGPIGQNLVAAGGAVTLAAPVMGDARAYASSVELTPEAKVSGNADFVGDHVHIGGPIEGRLKAMGDDIEIDTTVDGDVDAIADHIALGPNARINGRLRYTSSGDVQRDPAAQVNGAVERTLRTSVGPHSWRSWSRDSRSFPDERLDAWGPFTGWQSSLRDWRDYYESRGLTWLSGTSIVIALLMGALLPGLTRRLGATVSSQWGWSVFLGFAVLICAPILVAILAVTVIGIPVALLVVVAWLLLLFFGYAASGVALGDIALHQLAPARYNDAAARILAAVLAMVIVIAAARAPVVGGLVSFVAMLTGCGALLLQMRRGTATPLPAM
jgi:cytoskeletal protein CcmA (bactofilin family)